MKNLLLTALWLGLSACATPARQTDAFLRGPRDIPERRELANVPFVKQTENFCGPATLTMAMQWAGKQVSVDEIAGQVFTPGKKGTLQLDLIGASRRQGLLAVPIQGISALLHEVAAGHPVLVLENLAFSWYPRWHYALVYGYDLKEPELLMHSGNEEAKRWSLRKFERSWLYSQYWGLVVLPPGEMAATADELAHAEGAAGLEQLGKFPEAELVYRNILKRWPGSLAALIGLGNISYARGEFGASVKILREATAAHPDSPEAWHNLATAEGAAKMKKAARKSAARALSLAPPESVAIYRESLKEFIL